MLYRKCGLPTAQKNAKGGHSIGKILRQLCGWNGVGIAEAEVCPGHIHILVEIPPKTRVARFHTSGGKWSRSTSGGAGHAPTHMLG